jgi:hypothetical protein
MKKLTQYLEEVDAAQPQVGDAMLFEDGDDVLVESHIVDVLEDGIVIESDDDAEALLELNGYQLETIQRYGAVGNSPGMGFSQNEGTDYGPGDHLDRIENGQVGQEGALAEELPDEPNTNANHNDPLLGKAVDDAAVQAMESDLMSRILELAQIREADSWVGKDTDRPAHLRKAEYAKSMGSASAASRFRVPGDPNVPAQQRKIQPGDQPPADKKVTTAEGSGDAPINKMTDKDLADYIGQEASWVAAHRDEAERMAHDRTKDLAEALNKMRRAAGIMEDPTEEEPMPAQGGVASEPQHSVASEPGAAAARAFESRVDEAQSPVAQAIVQRILAQHTDLLQKYGPERLGDAIDAVASQVGTVDEIGTSDVSGWVREVQQELGTMKELEEMRRHSGLGGYRSRGYRDHDRDPYLDTQRGGFSQFDDSEFKDRDESPEELRRRAQRYRDEKLRENENTMGEAEYQGREVPLGKPMQGDVKKFKVYVRNPKTGNVKKVNFGDPDMRIKKSNPKRRKSFRARHRCDTAKDRTSARYWSCRKW